MQALKPQDLTMRFRVTEKGAYDLIMAETCQCVPKLSGLIVQCPACGTCYGYLTELDRKKDRSRPGRAR